MKKISIVIAGLMFSGVASAVTFDSSGTLLQQECGNLNEDVRINLTSGVVAGVNCRFGSTNPAQPDRVAIAACHTSGMLKSRNTTQLVTTNPDGTTTTTTGCATGTTGCTVIPVEGAAMPGATTLAGTVNIGFPGTGACTAARAETQAGTL